MEHHAGIQDHQIVGIIIFVISLVGSLGNWIVATSSQRLPSMQNSFGRLLASQSTGEAILCTIFAFYYSPMVFFDIEPMKDISKRFGLVALACYDICIFSHLFIAMNRMCAICLPLQYDVYFSRKVTKILIVISWVVPITVALVLYGYYDCDFVFDNRIWAFVFTQTEGLFVFTEFVKKFMTKECKFISWNIDFYKDISIVIVIAIVDILTIFKVHMTNLEIRRNGRTDSDRRRKNEINFLKQAVMQGMVFVVELYTYFYLAWQFENKWIVWALTTAAWNIVHCSDSLIILGFNAEFRKLLRTPKRIFTIDTLSQKTKTRITDSTSDKRTGTV